MPENLWNQTTLKIFHSFLVHPVLLRSGQLAVAYYILDISCHPRLYVLKLLRKFTPDFLLRLLALSTGDKLGKPVAIEN